MVAPLALIGALQPILSDLLDRAFPNLEERDRKRLEFETRLEEAARQVAMAQIEVNKTEAQHASIFVAGWRPFVGWVCGLALAYAFIIQPFMEFALANYLGKPVLLPDLHMDELNYILAGMLGIGAMRTVEKVTGVTTGRAPERTTKLPWLK